MVVTNKQGDGIQIIGEYKGVFDFRPETILSHKECLKISSRYFKGSEIKEARLLICEFENRTEICWCYEVFSKGPGPHLSVSVSAINGEIVWVSAEAIS